MIRKLSTVLIILVFCALPVYSQKPLHFSFGTQYTIHSKILNEDRTVLVSTPVRYERDHLRCPVLYIMDGRSSFLFASGIVDFLSRNNEIPPLIVVAIPNTDRDRDFTPTNVKALGNSGGADAFLDFLEKELIPQIETNFRTQPYRIFSGHSLCGLTAIHMMATRPTLFPAIIAMSPAMIYDNEATLDRLEQVLKKPFTHPVRLYITQGNEPGYDKSLGRLKRLLGGSSAASITWNFNHNRDLTHGTIPLKSLYDGLEYMFPGWTLKGDLTKLELEDIEANYKNLSTLCGYRIDPPELVINNLGYQLLQTKRITEALRVFKYNVQLHPESANAYDSYGEALEASGQLKLAIRNYAKAVELTSQNPNTNVAIFQNHLERARKRFRSRLINQ